jgi:hypothetical protein
MSYSEIGSTYRVARAAHSCEWCGETVQKGELHFYRVYRFEGDFNSGRMHLECEFAMQKSDRESVASGWYPGEFKRGEIVA